MVQKAYLTQSSEAERHHPDDYFIPTLVQLIKKWQLGV